MHTEPPAPRRTLDLSTVPPPSGFWPSRVTPDVLPFPASTFDRAIVGLDLLRASALQRLCGELSRVVVGGGEIELVVRDDEADPRLPEMVAAFLRAFEVRSITSGGGRLVVQARNDTTRRLDRIDVTVNEPNADASAALLCALRDRDTARSPDPPGGRPWRIDMAEAETVVRFEPARLPDKPPRRPGLRVASVLGERSRLALRYELALEPVSRDSWPDAFRPDPPRLLLVESAAPVGGEEPWVSDLLDRCREHGVTSVFWHNDDSVKYEASLRAARQFDWVFTVDGALVERYRADLGHDRVGVLPFGVQPRIHNPVGAFSARAGDTAYTALRLDTYEQLLTAYRRYRLFLDAEPAGDTLSRDHLEPLACGTPVAGGPSAKALLASPELRDRRAVEGIRSALRDHACADRVDHLLDTVGLGTGPRPHPRVSIVAPTHRLGGYEAILENVARQTYGEIELVLGLHGVDEPESRIREAAHRHGIRDLEIVRVPSDRSLGVVCNELIDAASGPYVARMDDDDIYGPHYLEDQMRAFEYTDADVVGKWSRFIYLETLPALGVMSPGNEHVHGPPLCGGTLLMRRELREVVRFADQTRGEDIAFIMECAKHGLATYATDRFNYVYVRHADKSLHTYQPDDLAMLSHTRIVSFGSSLEHAFV